MAAMGVTYLQLVLGGVVRHLGAGMACTEIPLCQGSLWPGDAEIPAQIHMAHRLWAVLVTGVVLFAAIKSLLGSSNRPVLRFLSVNLIFLVLLQVSFGLLSVVSGLQLFPVTAHLALGALLWVDLILVYFLLGGDEATWGQGAVTP